MGDFFYFFPQLIHGSKEVTWSSAGCDDDDKKLFDIQLLQKRPGEEDMRLCLKPSSSQLQKLRMMKVKGKIARNCGPMDQEFARNFEVSLGSVNEDDNGRVQLCLVTDNDNCVWFDLQNEFPWRILPTTTSTCEAFPRSRMEWSSDVIISTRGQNSIKCHKFLLACKSTVFEAMLKHDMVEKASNEINIVDFEDATVEDMVDYMYEGTLQDRDVQHQAKALEIANKFDIGEMRRACEIKLSHAINHHNAAEIWIAARRGNADELKKSIVTFFIDEMKRVVKKENVASLLTQLMELLHFLVLVGSQADVREDFFSCLRTNVRQADLSEKDTFWTEIFLLFTKLLFFHRSLMGNVLFLVQSKIDSFGVVKLNSAIVEEGEED